MNPPLQRIEEMPAPKNYDMSKDAHCCRFCGEVLAEDGNDAEESRHSIEWCFRNLRWMIDDLKEEVLALKGNR